MGCGDSFSGEGGMGGATEGTFPMFSGQSLACWNMKQAAGPFNSGGDLLSKEFPRNGDTYDMVKAWGVGPGNPISVRYTTGGQSLEGMDQNLDGATIDVPAGECVVSPCLYSESCARACASLVHIGLT